MGLSLVDNGGGGVCSGVGRSAGVQWQAQANEVDNSILLVSRLAEICGEMIVRIFPRRLKKSQPHGG